MDDLSIATKRTISGGACDSGRDMVEVELIFYGNLFSALYVV